MEAEIRRLTRRREGGDDSDEEAGKKKARTQKSYLAEELAKYVKGRGLHKKGKGRKDEGDVVAAMNKFRDMLQSSSTSVEGVNEDEDEAGGNESGDAGMEIKPQEEEEGLEVDDDRGFMNHVLHFPKDDGEEEG